ncbi:hypothetical protein A4R89_09425 [Acetobacter ascendens]|nr:hypothetical protein A4R89_09425 [Acetobacter ascendens]
MAPVRRFFRLNCEIHTKYNPTDALKIFIAVGQDSPLFADRLQLYESLMMVEIKPFLSGLLIC